jgi:hypothetical protein
MKCNLINLYIMYNSLFHDLPKINLTIPVTGSGGRKYCETLRLQQFLDNGLINGGDVSLTRPPAVIYTEEDS